MSAGMPMEPMAGATGLSGEGAGPRSCSMLPVSGLRSLLMSPDSSGSDGILLSDLLGAVPLLHKGVVLLAGDGLLAPARPRPLRLPLLRSGQLLVHLSADGPEALGRGRLLADPDRLLKRGHGPGADVVLHAAGEADHVAL